MIAIIGGLLFSEPVADALPLHPSDRKYDATRAFTFTLVATTFFVLLQTFHQMLRRGLSRIDAIRDSNTAIAVAIIGSGTACVFASVWTAGNLFKDGGLPSSQGYGPVYRFPSALLIAYVSVGIGFSIGVALLLMGLKYALRVGTAEVG